MTMLEKMQQSLIARTIEIYLDRRGEIELEEYPSYFGGMGDMIAYIEKFESVSAVTIALENGLFESIGLFPTDEDMFEEFFKDLK